jgi:hypothetical protein
MEDLNSVEVVEGKFTIINITVLNTVNSSVGRRDRENAEERWSKGD